MSYYREVSDNVLDYRDNRDRANIELRNILRRVQNKVNARIAIEHDIAEHEGRAIAIDMSPDGIRELIVRTVRRELGGDPVAAIEN